MESILLFSTTVWQTMLFYFTVKWHERISMFHPTNDYVSSYERSIFKSFILRTITPTYEIACFSHKTPSNVRKHICWVHNFRGYNICIHRFHIDPHISHRDSTQSHWPLADMWVWRSIQRDSMKATMYSDTILNSKIKYFIYCTYITPSTYFYIHYCDLRISIMCTLLWG